MESSGLIVTGFSMLGGILGFVISTFLVVKQIRSTQEWNRKKTSEEMLTRVITGDLSKLIDSLQRDHKWEILSDVPYEERVHDLSPIETTNLDIVLRQIMRHLEVICINMKHGIVHEDVCYDYLHSILTTSCKNAKGFIEKEREKRKEPRVFIEMQCYAARWAAPRTNERRWLKLVPQKAGFRDLETPPNLAASGPLH